MTGSLSRRAVLATLPFAFAAPFFISFDSAEPAMTGASQGASTDDESPALMRTICAHCVAYSEVRRLTRELDAKLPSAKFEALGHALQAERALRQTLFDLPTRNQAERHDKTIYLSGLFRSELGVIDDIARIPASGLRERSSGIVPSGMLAILFARLPSRVQRLWPFATVTTAGRVRKGLRAPHGAADGKVVVCAAMHGNIVLAELVKT
ncbi:MAG: hypothetical protein EOR00_24310 [Mesorhizobium sp.]|uniref:hypothetical protein n=1 Tax=Mesorhizobium sp. TaxID=1871066 RepID=UPI000FE67578|nr:hypothetical protein [Mesorhizobium sp.]RWP13965.1 MAG: hypothetical protein EOR00_24310 [Mesorhizobium sp.]